MNRTVLTVAVAAMAATVGAACGYKIYPILHKPPLPSTTRQNAILAHAAQVGRVETIVIGDSIVEQADLGDLCGDGAVLNAGVSGARAQDITLLMGELSAERRPKRVIIAVGINDTAKHRITPDGEFDRSYGALLETAKAGSDRVAVALVSPTTDAGPHGAGYFDKAAAKRFDAIIARLAKAHGAKVIDIGDRLGASGGVLPDALSADGPHLKPNGYALWKSAIKTGC